MNRGESGFPISLPAGRAFAIPPPAIYAAPSHTDGMNIRFFL